MSARLEEAAIAAARIIEHGNVTAAHERAKLAAELRRGAHNASMIRLGYAITRFGAGCCAGLGGCLLADGAWLAALGFAALATLFLSWRP